MAKITRGEFLGFGAALAGGIAVGAVGAPRLSSACAIARKRSGGSSSLIHGGQRTR